MAVVTMSNPYQDTREHIDFEELKSKSEETADNFRTASHALEAARLIRQMRDLADGGKGIKPAELATRLTVSKTRVSIIERGDGPSGPTYSTLKRVADACNVDFVVTLKPRK
jgi:Helix-turn-helix domain